MSGTNDLIGFVAHEWYGFMESGRPVQCLDATDVSNGDS